MNSVKRSLTRRIGSNPVKLSLESLRSKLRENQETRKRERETREREQAAAEKKALSNAIARQFAQNIMSRRGSKSVTRGVPQVVENTKHRLTQSQRNNPTRLAPGWRMSKMTPNVAKKLGVMPMPFSEFRRMSRKEMAAYISQSHPYARSR